MVSNSDLFSISNQKQFEKIALKTFRYQYENNLVYQEFCDLLHTNVQKVKTLQQIPFLPIQFFKSHNVLSSPETIQQTFTSSGTTGMQTSKHLVTDVSWYEMSYRLGFSEFYGNIEDYCVLALLPSYLERDGSSLIYMVEDLIQSSNHSASGEWRAPADHPARCKDRRSLPPSAPQRADGSWAGCPPDIPGHQPAERSRPGRGKQMARGIVGRCRCSARHRPTWPAHREPSA